MKSHGLSTVPPTDSSLAGASVPPKMVQKQAVWSALARRGPNRHLSVTPPAARTLILSGLRRTGISHGPLTGVSSLGLPAVCRQGGQANVLHWATHCEVVEALPLT